SKGTSSTLTVATSSATIGTWSVTVTGTSKSLVHTVAITLTVNYPASQSFRLAASPGSVQVLPGDTAQYAVTITRTGGYSGAIMLATTGLPAGATATYSPASPVTGNSTTLQVATTSSTPAGTFTIQVKGSAANQSAQTVTVQLVVTDKGKPFSISGAPTQRLSPGSIASPINLTLSNPNNQPMNVTNLTVTVVGTSAGSNCSASNFAVQQFSGTYPLALLKNQTASLQAMGIPQPKWPTVRMVNFPTVNQDACKNVTVFLSYAGAATGR
ncbi:MAG: hypothetical protein JO152_14570, partial [Mycobacteriaceae bacterium]|nr:hypothetical protein [Mycobacteriaceae bacterium]